jgi:hypothetical protein
MTTKFKSVPSLHILLQNIDDALHKRPGLVRHHLEPRGTHKAYRNPFRRARTSTPLDVRWAKKQGLWYWPQSVHAHYGCRHPKEYITGHIMAHESLRSSVNEWGDFLPNGMQQVRVPMSLKVINLRNPSGHTRSWGLLSL